MKHAFLIIAHNNFGVLQKIVSQLDSENCDFFIHYDRKVHNIPSVSAQYSHIFICSPRIDVRWGDFSQIKCEMTLLDFALCSGVTYDYYHIISGTHLPLVAPNGIDDYFRHHPSAVFQLMDTSEYEIDMKVRRWNLCTQTFKHKSQLIERSSQLVWRFSNAFQRITGIGRNKGCHFVKASQWCSLSRETARNIAARQTKIFKKYRWSFCGDEYFMASEVSDSPSARNIDFRTDYLYQRFNGASPEVLKPTDYLEAKDNGYLWARKFSE